MNRLRKVIIVSIIVLLAINIYQHIVEWANRPNEKEIKRQYNRVNY